MHVDFWGLIMLMLRSLFAVMVTRCFCVTDQVCVMGHVDHGKTTLLDTLRKLNITTKTEPTPVVSNKKVAAAVADAEGAEEVEGVAGTEAGGITQKLSAFGVEVSPGKNIMFLDTPGHAAFSSMRNHGAVATDLVILVVAIDDGVRPQTIEALKMAQDARCSIIVVLNKVDKIPYEERASARNRVLTQLLKHNLIVEEFGGDVQVAEVAGRTGEGIDGLMESLLLQAEVLELQAAITGQAEAVVLDAHVERGKGVVADVLVRWGALSVGDPIVVGGSYGKVKSMINDRGESIRTAFPSNSVRLLGLRSLPSTGAEMLSVDSENVAKEIAERRQQDIEKRREREEALAIRRAEVKRVAEAAAAQGLSASEAAAAAGSVDAGIKINLVIKADGVGTLEALKQIVNGIVSRIVQDISINVVAATVGDVSGSDIELVAAAGGESLILAFNVGVVDGDTRSMAKQLDVNICRDDVIYRLEDELVNTMLSYLPKERELQKEVSGTFHFCTDVARLGASLLFFVIIPYCVCALFYRVRPRYSRCSACLVPSPTWWWLVCWCSQAACATKPPTTPTPAMLETQTRMLVDLSTECCARDR